MSIELRLLAIDNDFQEYITPLALQLASERLKAEGIIWSSTNCRQSHVREFLSKGFYHALLLDNDFGEGTKTLIYVKNGRQIPLVYVSAYDLIGLKEQHSEIGGAPVVDNNLNPVDGITIVRKPGHFVC